jgi:uncharacterized protein
MVTPETIRRARADAGLTQSELARRTGVRQASISKFESGRVKPRPETFARILEATRLPPSVTLHRYRDAVVDAARRRRASNVRVVGDAALREGSAAGDVGLLVTFDPAASLLDAAGLMIDLKRILGTSVAVLSDRAAQRRRDPAVAIAL